ncbi:MAG: prolyl-tRNA synthetase associated domain-containing protein [Alphaproteobacteria bacterium]|nr:prolyl-tRNA synthetase associated domain-containing protein [Alphaproteobacteria bacterium]
MNELETIEAPLLARLAALGISVEIHRHPPLHTVSESQALRGDMPGAHIKNLFLRDKKRNKWLVTVPEDAAIDLKALRHVIGATGNLSFGNSELLVECLGVEPGSVTPFAVINDPDGAVTMVLARGVLAPGLVNAHPLHNQATAAIANGDLLRFLEDCGHPPQIIDLP